MQAKLYSDTVFQTNRLKVRKIKESDFDKLHCMQSDIMVMQYILDEPQTLEQNKKDIHRVIEAYSKEKNGFWVWAVEDENKDFIGTCALIFETNDCAEIGFRYLPEYWNKGFGTENTIGLIEFSKSLGILKELIAYADPKNIGSQKVLEKAGFKNHGLKFEEKYNSEDFYYTMTF